MLDKPDMDTDLSLAEHVTHVHRFLKPPQVEALAPEFIRSDILWKLELRFAEEDL